MKYYILYIINVLNSYFNMFFNILFLNFNIGYYFAYKLNGKGYSDFMLLWPFLFLSMFLFLLLNIFIDKNQYFSF